MPLELEVEGKLSANGYQTLIEYAYLSVAFIVDANNLNLLTAHVDLTTGKRQKVQFKVYDKIVVMSPLTKLFGLINFTL